MLRGGLGGLHALLPCDDPGYAKLRGSLALSPAGSVGVAPALKLDGTFALHPALSFADGAFMAKAEGPRIGFVDDYGWGTHANVGAILARKLKEPDDALSQTRQPARPVWQRTVLVVATEFGRTVRINGTGGTDHGTSGVMSVSGVHVAGGSVGGQRSGMLPGELYHDRDIHAATAFRPVFKGLLEAHMQMDEGVLATRVFPGSKGVQAQEGLPCAARAA